MYFLSDLCPNFLLVVLPPLTTHAFQKGKGTKSRQAKSEVKSQVVHFIDFFYDTETQPVLWNRDEEKRREGNEQGKERQRERARKQREEGR